MKFYRGRRRSAARTVRIPSEHACEEVRRLIRKEVLPQLGTLQTACKRLVEKDREVGRDIEIIAQAVSRIAAGPDKQ